MFPILTPDGKCWRFRCVDLLSPSPAKAWGGCEERGGGNSADWRCDKLLLIPAAYEDERLIERSRALGARLGADTMTGGVSYATRGNLIVLASPLVIGGREMDQALALLDRLLARFFPAP